MSPSLYTRPVPLPEKKGGEKFPDVGETLMFSVRRLEKWVTVKGFKLSIFDILAPSMPHVSGVSERPLHWCGCSGPVHGSSTRRPPGPPCVVWGPPPLSLRVTGFSSSTLEVSTQTVRTK